jgi:hypothetical protein
MRTADLQGSAVFLLPRGRISLAWRWLVRQTLAMNPKLHALRRPALAGALALFVVSAAGAAEVEVGLVTGGQQTGGISTREGTLDLAGGLLFGATVGWRVRPDGIVELAWSRQGSEATGDLATGPERFDVVIDTIEFGGLWETRPGNLRPFLGLSVGATRIAGPEQDFGDGWYFSGAIAGGVRYMLGEHALLRLEGRGTGVLISDGGALACSFPPGGCRLGVTGSTLGAFSARLAVAARF